jgi:UDP-N-acetyl-2-amino-2-deoxyglucuronate dehydrogenase
MMQKYTVAVLGCGAIFSRHIAAINNNPDLYQLIGIYDPNQEVLTKYQTQLNVKTYNCEDDVYADQNVNCVCILTPNNLHFNQAVKALTNKKNVILEKPATFIASQIIELENIAKQNQVKIFGVLQVRLNPTVIIVKESMNQQLLGNVRGCSLVQRWQRPLSYFTGWRGNMESGGGILREFGVHYLDVMQYLLGMPQVIKASFYNTKFFHTDVNDTIYSIFDFKTFGGSMEISIAAEPKNLECTLSIMGEQGFIKLGGKSLDEFVSYEFLSNETLTKFEQIKAEVLNRKVATLASVGASPYHPELYRQIVIKPEMFALGQMYNVISLVENIYAQK